MDDPYTTTVCPFAASAFSEDAHEVEWTQDERELATAAFDDDGEGE